MRTPSIQQCTAAELSQFLSANPWMIMSKATFKLEPHQTGMPIVFEGAEDEVTIKGPKKLTGPHGFIEFKTPVLHPNDNNLQWVKRECDWLSSLFGCTIFLEESEPKCRRLLDVHIGEQALSVEQRTEAALEFMRNAMTALLKATISFVNSDHIPGFNFSASLKWPAE